MTPEAFNRWLSEIKTASLASTDAEAANLIGVSANSIVTMKREGVSGWSARRTALACAAVLARVGPYE